MSIQLNNSPIHHAIQDHNVHYYLQKSQELPTLINGLQFALDKRRDPENISRFFDIPASYLHVENLTSSTYLAQWTKVQKVIPMKSL